MRHDVDFQPMIDSVKAVTMDEVVERLGLGRLPRDRKITSIYKSEKTPSLHVYKYDYFDYATGQGGDQIRFVMDYNHWPFLKAVKWLARHGDVGSIRKRQQQAVEDPPPVLNGQWKARAAHLYEVGEEAFRAWVVYADTKWSLTLADIIGFGSALVKDGGRTVLWTPHYNLDDQLIRGIKVRTIGAGKYAAEGSKFRETLYTVHPRPKPAKMVHKFIVEGESDTWVLQKMYPNANVFGLPSGAGLWRDEWRNHLPETDDGFPWKIIMDQDDAGKDAAFRIAGSLNTVGLQHEIVFPPSWAGGRLAEAVGKGWRPV